MEFFQQFFGGVPQQGVYGGRMPQRGGMRRTFARELHAAMASDFDREDLEYGNKILLPSSFLHELSTLSLLSRFLKKMFVDSGYVSSKSIPVQYPECGDRVKYTCRCSRVRCSRRAMRSPSMGGVVNLALISDMPKGRFVKIQPHETEFIDLANPRSILEMELRKYSCLTKGETIQIYFYKKFYKFNILEVKPESQYNAICVLETDVEVDFAPPLDHDSQLPGLAKRSSKVEYEEKKVETKPNQPFGGSGVRLDGKPIDLRKQSNDEKPKEEWDPRKHRLQNGVRSNIISEDFQGKGTELGGKKPPIVAPKPAHEPMRFNEPPKVISTSGITIGGVKSNEAPPQPLMVGQQPEETNQQRTFGTSGVTIGGSKQTQPPPPASQSRPPPQQPSNYQYGAPQGGYRPTGQAPPNTQPRR